MGPCAVIVKPREIDMGKVTYIPPKTTPRMPPIEDVNQSEVMLGGLLWAIVLVCLAGLVIWAVKRG
jgi:hypothetical protein